MQTSLEEFLMVNSNLKLNSRETSVIDARNLNTPKILKLGNNEGAKFFKTSIITLAEYFGVKWSDLQVKEFSNEMYDCFKNWNVADLNLFCKRVKSLYYGKLFGTFAPAHLMEWANEYDNEWIEASETISISKHNQFKKNEIDMGGTNEQTKLRDFLKNNFKIKSHE
jgi:hypothetical protein